jgi:hypothetical protein
MAAGALTCGTQVSARGKEQKRGPLAESGIEPGSHREIKECNHYVCDADLIDKNVRLLLT